MTDNERMVARAIGLVTYCPGIGTKRFAREMAWAAEHNRDLHLTPKQRGYLLDVAQRYRRQIPEDIRTLATRMRDEGLQ